MQVRDKNKRKSRLPDSTGSINRRIMGRTTMHLAVLLPLFLSLTLHQSSANQDVDAAAGARREPFSSKKLWSVDVPERVRSFAWKLSRDAVLTKQKLSSAIYDEWFKWKWTTSSFIANLTLKQDTVPKHEVHCSRERSRAAWGIIEEYLMPFVEQENYQISSKCRLHPENDLFREQEEHKIHFETNEWRCGFCKKSFRAEKFLDQHFDNRHNNLLNDSQGRCLADLCGALHCDHIMELKKTKSKCNPAAAAKNRHLCESLADNCFPSSQGHSASRLHELFLRQFCDAHACSGGKKPFSRGGRKQSSIFYLAVSILIVMLLPVFYILAYLNMRGVKKGIQDLKRRSKEGRKTKPS